MNANSTSPEGVPAPEVIPRQVNRLLQEIAPLLEASLSPDEFFAEFLQRVLTALSAVAGGIWCRTPQGNFQLPYQINLAATGLDQIPRARACHTEVLRLAARRDKPLWVPPHSGPGLEGEAPAPANLTPYGLLLAPILIDKQVAGLVEIWQGPDYDPKLRKNFSRFLGEIAGFAAAYLHRAQWQQLLGQQQLWSRLEAFSRQIHGSLDAREVAYLVANQGRPLLECDQLSVALRRGSSVTIEAVSGATGVEARSPLVESMRALLAAVLGWGEKLVYRGTADETSPPQVRKALDAYLAQSTCKLLVALPLYDEREPGQSSCRSALLAESFAPQVAPEQLESRLTVLGQHAAPALYNAVQYQRVPLRWLWQPLAGVRDRLRGRGWLKLAVVAALMVLVAGALWGIQVPLRMNATGQFLPKDRQIVFATLNGKIVDVKAQHGDRVDKGQELLFMEDLESQLKVEQLAVKINSAEQRLATLSEQLTSAVGEDRNALIKERINQQYELRKALVERDILLQECRTPRKAPVVAPLAGKVVTFDATEQLLGKTVKPGDPLLRIARVDGPWEIELLIPEGHIGPIREALRRSPDGSLEVDLLLASHPQQTFQGRLYRGGLGGETIVKDNVVVLPARVRVIDRALLAQRRAMPVGVEVRAKIRCGRHALGYVWFFDLVEFFYEHVVF